MMALLAGPAGNILLGAVTKLVVVIVINIFDLIFKGQENSHSQDKATQEALAENQRAQASDPFVKFSRRILFLYLVLTYCYMAMFYHYNPDIAYDILLPKSGGGIFGMFSGSADYQVIRITGGYHVAVFNEVVLTVLGFFVVQSSKR